MYKVRENCGKVLAEEAPVKADIVSTIPESATPSALGYAKALGIPYAEVGLCSISDILTNSSYNFCQRIPLKI